MRRTRWPVCLLYLRRHSRESGPIESERRLAISFYASTRAWLEPVERAEKAESDGVQRVEASEQSRDRGKETPLLVSVQGGTLSLSLFRRSAWRVIIPVLLVFPRGFLTTLQRETPLDLDLTHHFVRPCWGVGSDSFDIYYTLDARLG